MQRKRKVIALILGLTLLIGACEVQDDPGLTDEGDVTSTTMFEETTTTILDDSTTTIGDEEGDDDTTTTTSG